MTSVDIAQYVVNMSHKRLGKRCVLETELVRHIWFLTNYNKQNIKNILFEIFLCFFCEMN